MFQFYKAAHIGHMIIVPYIKLNCAVLYGGAYQGSMIVGFSSILLKQTVYKSYVGLCV